MFKCEIHQKTDYVAVGFFITFLGLFSFMISYFSTCFEPEPIFIIPFISIGIIYLGLFVIIAGILIEEYRDKYGT